MQYQSDVRVEVKPCDGLLCDVVWRAVSFVWFGSINTQLPLQLSTSYIQGFYSSNKTNNVVPLELELYIFAHL